MHIDLPTRTEIERLLDVEGPCASVYLPTNPQAREVETERIQWKHLTAQAVEQLGATGLDKRRVAAFADVFDEVAGDEAFWYHQARTLAVFTDGENVHSYRIPSRLEAAVDVGDRLFLKPLLRAVTFPHACFVLALAQGSVRVLEVGADFGPYEVPVPGLPADASEFTTKDADETRVTRSRRQGSERQKVRAHGYARAVDRAVRDALRGHDLPVILAATEPTASIFRSVSTSPHLVAEGLDLSPEKVPDAELAVAAREVLGRVDAEQIARLHARVEERANRGRVATDLADIARAATAGTVDTLVVDIDAVVRGSIDAEGWLDRTDDPGAPDAVDEMARRVLQARGEVVAVRTDDVPGAGPAVAILRFA